MTDRTALGILETQGGLQEIKRKTQSSDYADLQRIISQKGLLDKQPAYYIYKGIFTLGLLALGITFLFVIDNFWLQLLNAVFLAYVFTQFGFMAHDAGHRQISRAQWINHSIGMAVNFFIGMSRSWWVDQHDLHHANPNDPDIDPHIAIPVLAYSDGQLSKKQGLLLFLIKFQAYYFTFLLFFEGLGIRFAGIQYLIQAGNVKNLIIEGLLLILHFVVYFGLILYVLGGWQAVAFIVLHQALLGLYAGSVFAPNHKGMPMFGKDSGLDFLRRQVLTSRNVIAHPIVADLWFGGLNYQIEHHLFTNMPRNKLGQAREVVKEFCKERSVSYYETGLIQSYKETLRSLNQVGATLREEGA